MKAEWIWTGQFGATTVPQTLFAMPGWLQQGTNDSQHLRSYGLKGGPCDIQTCPHPQIMQEPLGQRKGRAEGCAGGITCSPSSVKGLMLLPRCSVYQSQSMQGSKEFPWEKWNMKMTCVEKAEKRTLNYRTLSRNILRSAIDQSPFSSDLHHNIWPAWCYFRLCFLLLFTQIIFSALSSLCQSPNDLETSNSWGVIV